MSISHSPESFDLWAASRLSEASASASRSLISSLCAADAYGCEFWRGYLAAVRAFDALLTDWKSYYTLHTGGADVYDE